MKQAGSGQQPSQAEKKAICWGLLLHMIGLQDLAEEQLASKKLKDKKYRELAEKVIDHAKATGGEDLAEIRREIVRCLGEILDPKRGGGRPMLSREPRRCSDYRGARDSPKSGYSRDPFKKIEPQHFADVALAAVCYVARAHSLFFCRRRTDRSFNSAKVALNDLFQASQLAYRLYHSLQVSHLNAGSQDDCLEQVRRGGDCSADPWSSPFFAWWLVQLVEIQRGNIYRGINYEEEADHQYRAAQERFDRLAPGPRPLDAPSLIADDAAGDEWFVTPTLVRALFEWSKVLFDRGKFVDSIATQLRCLAYLVRGSAFGRERTRTDDGPSAIDPSELLTRVSAASKYLDVVRRHSVIDKARITRIFGCPDWTAPEWRCLPPMQLRCQDLVNVLKNLELDLGERKLAAEVFALLGGTLYLFRPHRIFETQPPGAGPPAEPRQAWLMPFFSVHSKLSLAPQPPAAKYFQSLLGAKQRLQSDARREIAFPDSLERELAWRLRTGLQVAGQDPRRRMLLLVTQALENVVTIPQRLHALLFRRGYKWRRTHGDLSKETVFEGVDTRQDRFASTDAADPQSEPKGNKLVVLRRWQSFTPKIPRPGRSVRGGGYFLVWRGKGIVIDPGYDFIRNFYEEGFSLDDVDAVMVTHSHPDHDDDLSTLTTLVREWNEYHAHLGAGADLSRRLDIFLNESAHLKFSRWLTASRKGIGRIVPLPLLAWSIWARRRDDERPIGENVRLDLKKKYSLKLEVIPAWHDDVIGKNAAVGLKFHLFLPPNQKSAAGIVGYTGDTGCYKALAEQYAECDVLIAHLGDIKLRELFSSIASGAGGAAFGKPICDLVAVWFSTREGVAETRVTPERVGAFHDLLVTLDLAPPEALEAVVGVSEGREITVAEALNRFTRSGRIRLAAQPTVGELMDQLDISRPENRNETETVSLMGKAVPRGYTSPLEDFQIAYALLAFISGRALVEWSYEYHLGVSGVLELQQALIRGSRHQRKPKRSARRRKVLIVDELPEELASYRHHVARLLRAPNENLFCFTGDIGLHVRLREKRRFEPKIRCVYCNYNNETVLRRENYHSPEKILETALKQMDSAVIYLCTKHDHHPENEDQPYDFLTTPNLRVI